MAVMVIHPGEHLAEELKALEMSAAELARKISVPTNRVTQILNGTRSGIKREQPNCNADGGANRRSRSLTPLATARAGSG